MADLIKKIKIKKQDGTFTDYIPIGAEAQNVLTSDGDSVQLKLNRKPYYYNSVADMKADTKLKTGDMAVTLGYYEPNDGGGAEYQILSGSYEDDGGYYHQIINSVFAKLIIKDDIINIKQFGAKGDNSFDNTNILKALFYEKTHNKTIVIPEGTYLTHSIGYYDNGSFKRKNVVIQGLNKPTIKINHNTATETVKGTYTGSYTVSEGFGELNFGNSCYIDTVVVDGHTFYYLSITDKSLIPDWLEKEQVLKGKNSKTYATIASIDKNNPDGENTARIYLYETYNDNKKQLNFQYSFEDPRTKLTESLIVKEHLSKNEVYYISFENNTIPSYINETNLQIRQSNGNKARVNNINFIKNNINYIKIDCFNDDYNNTIFSNKALPLDNTLPFEIVKYSNPQKGFMTLNGYSNINIENIKFDGANYDVSIYTGNGNDYNMIYLSGSKNITIENCEFSNCIMSGLHIGGAGNAYSYANHDFPEDILINNCIFNNNGRGDAEIIYGKNIKITNCTGSGYLDIESNGNEILENIYIDNCVFKSTTPYAPAIVSASSIIHYSNCHFDFIQAAQKVVLNLTSVVAHDITAAHSAVINGVNCIVNHFGYNSPHGNGKINLSRCTLFGLDYKLPSANGSTQWNFNNCLIDLSLSRSIYAYGIKNINFNNCKVFSTTRYGEITTVSTTWNCNNTVFQHIHIVAGNNPGQDSCFRNCQFLLKDKTTQVSFAELQFYARLENCFIQTNMAAYSSTAFISLYNCILDAETKPYVAAGHGLYANNINSNDGQGISWIWVGAGHDETENDKKINFQNVYLNKDCPGKLGVGSKANGLSASRKTVSDNCKAFWVDKDDIFASKIYYNSEDATDNTLYIKDLSFPTV